MVFHKGSKVIIKRGMAPAIIREALGPKTWKVELVDSETGAPKGVFVDAIKSQQM